MYSNNGINQIEDGDLLAKKGIITMTTEGGDVILALMGTGEATVDWGDGSEEETLTIEEENVAKFQHEYPNASTHKITVCGENITGLNCSYIQLTSLDVSNNTALLMLDCVNNQLTSLDVSNNTALAILNCCGNQLTVLDVSKNSKLIEFDCSKNQLTADALIAITETLYSNTDSNCDINMSGNPGTEHWERAIAEKKMILKI